MSETFSFADISLENKRKHSAQLMFFSKIINTSVTKNVYTVNSKLNHSPFKSPPWT